MDTPDFRYPVITGDYKLGVNVHPWKSETIDTGAPVAKPKPIFAKIPQEAVQEELDRFEDQLAQRKAAEAERLAKAKAQLADKESKDAE